MAYPVTARYLAAIASNNVRYSASVTVLSGGQPVPGYTNLPVEAATVSVSRTQAQRSTLTVQLTPSLPGLGYIVPARLADPIAPNGNELALTAGLVYPDGTTETVPCGIFPIQTVTVTDTGNDLTMQVTCADRSWSISRRALQHPVAVGTSVTLDQAIRQIVSANTSGLPSFAYSIAPTTQLAAPATYHEGQDPWQAALDLAVAAGFELFFDRYGNLASRPVPAPGTIAVAWAATHATQAGPLAVSRTFTANQVVNDITVFSTATTVTPPVRGNASDTNPGSPTYTGGNFGDIPSYYSSTVITTAAAAQAAAQGLLTVSLGKIDSLTLTVVPNPAVDVDDVYTVTRPRAGLNGEQWIVDGYQLPLQIGATMTVNLRRVTL